MKVVLDKAETKSKEKANKVDKGLLKSKVGGIWKKITGPKEQCNCEKCHGRAKKIEECEKEKQEEDAEPKPELGGDHDDDDTEFSHD